jgi:heptosyltransferase-2
MFDISCKNLLVRGVNWIGDGVMILPALRALRKALPETKISLLVKPWVSSLYERDPNVDEIIIYGDEHRGILGKIKLSRVLRRKDFCSAILLQNAFDAALITFLAGIKQRAGYNSDGRGFLLTNAVRVSHNVMKEHQIKYYLNLIEELGISVQNSKPYIYISVNERLLARKTLQDLKRPVLGINPGATYGSAKRWFPERFAEVANWFISDLGGSVVIFGGNPEVDIADEIYKKLIPEFRTSHSLMNLAGKTSLRDLISLISECDVFLTNDSGPLHIAYSVKTPLVAIFGSTDPQLTGPPPDVYGNGNVIITSDTPCRPCFKRTCKNNDMMCMYAITSDDVYYGIKDVLPDKPAVFFDRDGTLCKDMEYINKYDNLYIFEDIDSVNLLKEKGFKLIGVTNQSGIARGFIDERFVKEVNNIFIKQYGFDDFYYCPHHPDDNCSCRKPEPEMLFRARVHHGINLKKSYVIGDKESDMLLAKAVGAKGILVQTGNAKDSQYADFIAKNMQEAVHQIIQKIENY